MLRTLASLASSTSDRGVSGKLVFGDMALDAFVGGGCRSYGGGG